MGERAESLPNAFKVRDITPRQWAAMFEGCTVNVTTYTQQDVKKAVGYIYDETEKVLGSCSLVATRMGWGVGPAGFPNHHLIITCHHVLKSIDPQDAFCLYEENGCRRPTLRKGVAVRFPQLEVAIQGSKDVEVFLSEDNLDIAMLVSKCQKKICALCYARTIVPELNNEIIGSSTPDLIYYAAYQWGDDEDEKPMLKEKTFSSDTMVIDKTISMNVGTEFHNSGALLFAHKSDPNKLVPMGIVTGESFHGDEHLTYSFGDASAIQGLWDVVRRALQDREAPLIQQHKKRLFGL